MKVNLDYVIHTYIGKQRAIKII